MRKRHYRYLGLIAVLLLIVLAVTATACGGSSETTATTAAAETETTAASTGESGSIVITGLVNTPMTFTTMDMDYMYWTTITADHPSLGSQEFEGVLLSDLFSYVGVEDDATQLIITGSDGTSVSVPLADLSGTEALITVDDAGAMSAIMPGMASDYWVEDIVGMNFE